MKKITKPDPKQARSVVTFGSCGCVTCNDCNSTATQAYTLGIGAEASYRAHVEYKMK